MSDEGRLTLTHAELVELTGYRRAAEQVAELQRQGYSRARRCKVTGRAILERAHYLAVCAGHQAEQRPRVKPPNTGAARPALRAV